MRILAVCDLGCTSGFATVARNVLGGLVKKYGHEVHCLAINYDGDPHPDQQFATLYPAHTGGDSVGIGRIGNLAQQIKPDVIWLLSDIQVHELWLKALNNKYRTLCYSPIDSKDFHASVFNCFDKDNVTLITYTQFGYDQIKKVKPNLDVKIISHGIDTNIFYPITPEEKTLLRKSFGIPDDLFIFLNVNRNQLRKNIPATMRAFASIKNRLENPALYMHMVWNESPPRGAGWNIQQLAEMYGIEDKMMKTYLENVRGEKINMTLKDSVTPSVLADIYRLSDVFVTTTFGEGFGLTLAESQACGVPVIAPDCSAIPELIRGQGMLAKIDSYITMHYGTRFAIVNEHDVAKKMMRLATDDKLRKELGSAAAEWGKKNTWEPLVDQWNDLIMGSMA